MPEKPFDADCRSNHNLVGICFVDTKNIGRAAKQCTLNYYRHGVQILGLRAGSFVPSNGPP